MIVTYADEYVEAIMSKWQKMLPSSNSSYEYRSNVALALENQYIYHKKSQFWWSSVSEEIGIKLAMMSFKVLPALYILLEPLSKIVNFVTFIGHKEMLRTNNKNYDLTTRNVPIINPAISFKDEDYTAIAYSIYQDIESRIFNAMNREATNAGQKYIRNNTKLDRNIQFVRHRMVNDGLNPNYVICQSRSEDRIEIDQIGNWDFNKYVTKNNMLKKNILLGNSQDFYYCTYVPLVYNIKDVDAITKHTSLSNKIRLETQIIGKIVENNSLGVIHGV